MADLNSDLRLAVDTGKVTMGIEETMSAINTDKAKLVVVSVKGRGSSIDDIKHVCSVAGIRLLKFNGSSLELGAVCGKPYSVSALAVIEPGNSNIMDETY